VSTTCTVCAIRLLASSLVLLFSYSAIFSQDVIQRIYTCRVRTSSGRERRKDDIEIRKPKSEFRRPKEIRIPKAESTRLRAGGLFGVVSRDSVFVVPMR
jgi:hypothetical protein